MERDPAEEYKRVMHLYEAYASEIAHLIDGQVRLRGIATYGIEHRAKALASFLEKIDRPDKNYKDPLTELADLAGVRVLVYRLDDVQAVIDICSDLFDVYEDESRRLFASINEFGYESAHLVVSPGEKRSQLAEWKPFRLLRAEVQIRTLLQHSWATTSHALEYKRKGDVPPELQRRLSRIAALLELADTEFGAIALEHERSKEVLRSEAASDPAEWDADLDIDSLREFLQSEPLIAKMHSEAESVGFRVNREETYLEEFLVAAGQLGIDRITDVRSIVRRAPRKDLFAGMVQSSQNSWGGSDVFLLLTLLAQDNRDVIDQGWLIDLGWHGSVATNLLSAISDLDMQP